MRWTALLVALGLLTTWLLTALASTLWGLLGPVLPAHRDLASACYLAEETGT